MEEEIEIWKDIKDFEGLYQVSTWGRVKSLNYKRSGKEGILRPVKQNKGYLMVTLCKDGKHKQKLLHILVAGAFILNPENKPYIDHIDGNKLNNFYLNLRWCTYKENNNNPITRKRISKSKKGIPNIKQAQINRNNPKTSKKVIQLDKNNNFIKEWLSTRDIERNTEYGHEFIASCCRGNHEYAYGYKWMYIADYKKMFGQLN